MSRFFTVTLIGITLLISMGSVALGQSGQTDWVAVNAQAKRLQNQRSADFATRASTPYEHYKEYLSDKQACADLVSLLKRDKLFLKALFAQDLIASSAFPAPYTKHRVAQYINKNHTRFVLYTDMETASIGSGYEGFRCETLVDVRMEKMEALGVSDESWLVRKEFLNFHLTNLNSPYDCAGYGTGYGNFYGFAHEASRLYRYKQKAAFADWTQQAIARINKFRLKPGKDEICGGTVKSINAELLSWRKELETLLK